MATILCVTSGMPSVLLASVELARRLAAAGHRVVFASLPEARALVEHHRLEFLELEPCRYRSFLEIDSRAGLLERLWNLRRRREQARESLAVDGFARAVRDLAPDLLLINGEMHEQILTAAATGLPIALLNSFVSVWRRPGLPPPHCLVRPGVGWRGSRAGIAALWLALRLRKRLRVWSQRVARVGCDRSALLGLLAREGGMELRREVDDSQWLIPFTYRRLPVLSLHALEFELPHRPPETVHYVGPMVLESRAERELPASERARLEAVLGRSRRAGGSRTLIYAGFGSAFSARVDLVRRLLGVVVGRPEWELVVGLSGGPSPADLGRLPERTHLFGWLPQLELLRHADAAVTHGGIGTLDECVLAGVPVLVYCGFETDMAGATARVVHHGIGIAGDRRDGTPAIRDHLDRLLREPRYRDRIGRLRALYAAYGDQRRAEKAVDRLLARQESAAAGLGPGGASR